MRAKHALVSHLHASGVSFALQTTTTSSLGLRTWNCVDASQSRSAIDRKRDRWTRENRKFSPYSSDTSIGCFEFSRYFRYTCPITIMIRHVIITYQKNSILEAIESGLLVGYMHQLLVKIDAYRDRCKNTANDEGVIQKNRRYPRKERIVTWIRHSPRLLSCLS